MTPFKQSNAKISFLSKYGHALPKTYEDDKKGNPGSTTTSNSWYDTTTIMTKTLTHNTMFGILVVVVLLTYPQVLLNTMILRSFEGNQQPNQRRQDVVIVINTLAKSDSNDPDENNHIYAPIINVTDPVVVLKKDTVVTTATTGTNDPTMDPILGPILREGIMYSMCRGDRSGSVIADMMYAHAFAHAHNITYGGNCCVRRGLPRDDTRELLDALHWNTIFPFNCPAGVDNIKFNILRPNATEIHPLLLNAEVYRFGINTTNFKHDWKVSVQSELEQYSEVRTDASFHMAVHVRRGDVSPCRHMRKYLPNSHFLALIDKYMPNATVLNGRSVVVTIYSESDTYEPFDVFQDRKYKLELDTDLPQVWKALSNADVAILSRSYFSLVPATINPNTVVATEFFELDVRDMDGWEHADPSLVKESDTLLGKMNRQCNVTVKTN
jgi:hypothetical protein